MPIVKMDRLTLVGMDREREAVIEALMRLGAIHIDQKEDKTSETAASGNSKSRYNTQDTFRLGGSVLPYDELPHLLSRLEQVISACTKLKPIKKPMFSARRAITADRFQSTVERQAEILANLDRFEAAKARIGEIDSQTVRLRSTEAMLVPWRPLQVDLAYKRSQKTRSFLGSFRNRTELEALDEALADEAPESITDILSEDEAGLHIHVITLRIRESMVLANLRKLNFTFLPVEDESATPKELLERILAELDGLHQERESKSGQMQEIAGKLVDFEILYDDLKMKYDQYDVRRRLSGTGRTFYLEGWVPSKLASSVEKGLAERFTVAFSSRAALPGEKYPILLQNRKLIKPYEVVVEMFNPPQTSEIDPTPVLAPFYFLFFGMMLSDVGYGLILSALCAIPLFIFKIRGGSRKTFLLFFQCGLSAIFWGIMFGGYFGDMISVVSSGRVVIPPALFDPLKNPTTLMLLSATFGIIHLFTGMATKAYILIRSGDWRAAVLDVFPWYLVIIGLLLTIAGIGKPFAGYVAIAGAAIIVLFSARSSRNPLARIGKGLYTLYGITSYFGDILSYSRILALVLATSVIAMVVNKIGFLFGPTFIGYIIFILVAIVGHVVNFALSALSAYIHTSRLHFVEFFGKFYEGGGQLWKPQKLSARYVDIERSPVESTVKNAG